jgi:adenylate kinase
MAMSGLARSMTIENVKNKIAAPIYLIFLGPPGSGKGTQSEALRKRLCLAHLSTGDLFRENISQATPLGLKVKSILDAGALVPDDITVAMVMERIKEPDTELGVIFDGFPRTLGQAVALDEKLQELGKHITRAIYFNVPDQVIIERLSQRRMCPNDGTLYNLKSKLPQNDNVCDLDGTPLIQREDDKPEVVQKRLRVYHENTAPLIKYYRERGLVSEIDGSQDIARVEAELEALARSWKYGN